VIGENQMAWLKEYLERLAIEEADKENAADIAETFRNLWTAIKVAEKMLRKPPAEYQTHSRKSEFKIALDTLYQRGPDGGKLPQ
jgi:hypothetical protein